MKKITLATLLIYVAYTTNPAASTPLPEEVKLSTRHQVSGLNSHFPRHLQNFEHYIDHYRDVISRARTDLTEENREKVIKGNAPFQLQPAAYCKKSVSRKHQRGIVLIHGLTDSAYQTRHLAQYFQQQCFYVMAMLLPGHGTRPGDMLDMLWEDWVAATDFVFEQMANRVNDIYMAGYSTGGTLALLKASQDSRVKGLFVFSPAVKISNFAALAGSIDLIGTLFGPMKWLQIMQDEDDFKYESFAYNAASQIYQLTKVTQKALAKPSITVPVFAVTSAQDSTVDIEATVELMKTLRHKKNRMLLYSQHQRSEPAPIKVINSHFPEKRQLSLAHTGLIMPIDDSHYGENGSYRHCGHYYQEGNENYVKCKDNKKIFVGEITEENLNQGILARATYNFLYREMLLELDNFIDKL